MKRIKLTDLIPDEHNANRHSERGVYMVNKSLEKLGAGRSIVVDKNGKIVAGNLTAEQAADLGIEDVIVVETTGNELVAVMRTDYDLDDPHGPARQYAYADNQAAAVSIDFDPQVIADDLEAGIDLGDWFKQGDFYDMGVVVPDFAPVGADEQPRLDQKKPVICPECGHEFQA